MSGKQLLTTSLVFILFYITYQFVGYKFGLIKQVPIETQEVTEPIDPSISGQQDSLPKAPVDLATMQAENADVTTDALSENDELPVETEQFVPEIEQQTITLTNGVMEVILDNKGGVVRKVTMSGFYESIKNQENVVLVSAVQNAPAEIIFDRLGTTANQVFSVEQPQSSQVIFKTIFQGISIEKTFTLRDDYAMDLNIDIEGSGSEGYQLILAEGLEPLSAKDRKKKSLFSFLSAGSSAPKMMLVAWSEEGDHESKAAQKFESNRFERVLEQDEILPWAGIVDTYFCNVFLPETPFNNFSVKNNFQAMPTGDPMPVPVVAVQGQNKMAGTFYMGPLNESDLLKVNPDLSNLVNYGYTGKLTKWMFIALEWIYSYVGNWGWAIVILTIFIRLAMFPLTAPSIKSGYKMRKIQPKLEALKKKHPGTDMESKQKLSQETWKLYKQEKVNPFSSCITILPQMPIFIAYFSLLRTSISLRQSGWLLWINDLSLKDPFFVLPLLWGASMYLSQTMTPMPGDPSQQKMMKYMPIMMTLLFITMPSGLVLYMVTSNVFQLGQTILFKWRYDKA